MPAYPAQALSPDTRAAGAVQRIPRFGQDFGAILGKNCPLRLYDAARLAKCWRFSAPMAPPPLTLRANTLREKMNINSLVPMQLAVEPKLEHKNDLRIADILSRLRTTFADKGFDGASMQDLARAAGISVGSFYRYFPSKSDIIAKMISVDMDDMQAQFAAVTASPHPMNALRALIRSKIATAQLQKEGQLWAEIAAMSCRNAQIGVYSNEMETAVAQYLTRIFAIDLNISPAISARLFAAEAAYIMLMVRSAATLSPHGSATLADVNALILRSIDHTLDTISAYHADASKRDLPPSSGSKG